MLIVVALSKFSYVSFVRKVYEDAEALYRHLSHLKVLDETLAMLDHPSPEASNSINSPLHPDID